MNYLCYLSSYSNIYDHYFYEFKLFWYMIFFLLTSTKNIIMVIILLE